MKHSLFPRVPVLHARTWLVLALAGSIGIAIPELTLAGQAELAEGAIEKFQVSAADAETLEEAFAILSNAGGGSASSEITSAIAILERASSEGNTKALRRLGDIFRLGKLVEADAERAMSYFARAADQFGDVDAAAALGFMLATGNEVTADPQRAVAYLQRVVTMRDDPNALKALGDIYRDDAGLHDPVKAKEYYSLAAARGNEWAYLALGDMAFAGSLGDRNLDEAERNYARALELGSERALRSLGNVYVADSPMRDVAKAADYYRKAAEDGDVRAALALGRLYKQREVSGGDGTQAIDLLEPFATGPEEAAVRKLIGDLYRAEESAESNTLAALSYERAAELGDGWAVLALGDMAYKVGDPSRAEELYRQAAALGVPRGHLRLGDLAWRRGDPGREATARNHYEKAEKAGDALAGLRVARAQQSEYGDSASIGSALTRYQTAVDEIGVVEAAGHLLGGNTNGLVAIVQTLLRAGGYDVGPVDGLFGHKTIRSVRRFCRERDLQNCDGGMNREIVAALLTFERVAPNSAHNQQDK